MADETQGAKPTEQTEAIQEAGAQPTVSRDEYDRLLAQSRKWEERAKSNAAAAKELDAIKAQSMTDAERLEAASKRADDAEARLAAYEAEAKRARDASEVAEATGVPASLLTAADRKSMERQAESIIAFARAQPSAPVFKGDGQRPGGDQKGTPIQSFSNFFDTISHM